MEAGPQGQIKGVSLTALLQMFEMEKTTCTLKISCEQDAGHLFLTDGELVAAETSMSRGLAAAHEIIRWDNVVISFAEVDAAPSREINQPMMTILMDGLRLKDEGVSGPGGPPPKDASPMPGPSIAGDKSEDDDFPELSLDDSDADDEAFPELSLDDSDADDEAFPELSLDDSETEEAPFTESSLDGKKADTTGSTALTEAAVEQKIAVFINKIAIHCPLCGLGRILAHPTDKGRSFYKCSNPHCGLISWEKIYAFRCPKCANPYLTESEKTASGGEPGLECPKPDCNFHKPGLLPPDSTGGGSDGDTGKPKKRVRIVRRKS